MLSTRLRDGTFEMLLEWLERHRKSVNVVGHETCLRYVRLVDHGACARLGSLFVNHLFGDAWP